MGLLELFPLLLVCCFIGWVVSRFATRLLTWFLSRLMSASVEFEVAGCNSLRDITMKFRKGSIDYVSVGEFKLTLGRSRINTGSNSVYSHPKLQLLICDIEVVTKKSELSNKKRKSQGSNSRDKGKLLLNIANLARFLSVCIKEVVVKVPKAIIEVKELRADMHKDSGADPFFNFFLDLTPLLVQMNASESSFDQSSDYNQSDCLFARKECSSILEKNPAIICEDISIACEFGHERERLKVRALDLSTGDITVDLNENLFLKTNTKSGSSAGTDASNGAIQDDSVFKRSKKFPLESIKKSFFVFPDKVSFSMPIVDVKFTHRGQDLSFHNSILGVNLSSNISKSTEDLEEDASHVVFGLNFNEIHLLKGGEASVIEILKLFCNASIDVPVQENEPIKVGANLKIGVTKCNLILNRLIPWLKLHSSGKRKMVLREETPSQERSQASERKDIMWTCAVSAPEFSIFIYSLNELPLYRGYCQSCNFCASNMATKEIQVHTELSELFLLIENGRQAHAKKNLLGEEKSSGTLLNIKRLNIDWGLKEMQSHERDNSQNWKMILSVDVTGMGVFLNFQQIESLISTMMSYKTLLISSSPSNRKVTQSIMSRSRKTTIRGTQIMKVNIDSCMITLCGNMTVEDTVVADPKHVNFGSQGGQVVISESSDGTPRTAIVLSNLPSGCNHVNFKTSVEVIRLSLYINKENESTQIGLERARSIYQELTEDEKLRDKITIFDMHKAKFLRRASGMTDAIRSLFSAADIAVRWEPDVHLALYEFAMRLKFLIQNNKRHDSASVINELFLPVEGTVDKFLMDPVQSEKQNHKRDSVFAVDVEKIRISAELADGVEAMIHASSIFSENAKIGVLLEGFLFSFNEARVLKSGRMQISSVPTSTSTSIDAVFQPPTTRDWVIQGLDVHVCLPYRLQLRAIDDAVEEMFRGLNLVTAALSTVTFPIIKERSRKMKSETSKVGSLRVIFRRLTADIEEEPMQGWLDEHYYLLKNEVCEVNALLKFLDEVISVESRISEGTEPIDHCSERMIDYNGVKINIADISSVQLLREEIYRRTFKSYYQACQKIVLSDGSGACSTGFQSGFKPSKIRASLLSISATDLDVNLTKIGGLHGMIEFINKVDPFCLENDIPFSRLYGTDLLMNAGSLLVQLRNYAFPIFAGNSAICHGRIVLAQQATCFQPQVQQDVFVGKWRRVRMFRSVSGTTPVMKTYLDLSISFHEGEISFGVGYEPVFADLSYAFTVALRRAKLGFRSSNPNLNVLEVTPPPKKERSLPWWDDMRYYIHGKIGLKFSTFEANVLATSDPYEKQDKVQIISQEMDIQQTDGQVKASSKNFRIYISSIHGLLKNSRLKIPCGTSIPCLNCPAFSVDVTMGWECESGNPLNHYLHALPNEGVPRQKIYDPFRSLSLSLRWNFSLGVSEPSYDEHAPSKIGDGSREKISNEFSEKLESISVDPPIFKLGVYDLVWLIKWWNMVYLPPNKLRSFSRWPRFGVSRVPKSGNLSLDKVLTEFFLRIDSTPTCIKHLPLRDDDPAKGLTFRIAKLKCEFCWGRGKQKYTFDCKRHILDLVYHGIDLHLLKVYLDRDMLQSIQTINSISQSTGTAKSDDEICNIVSGFDKNHDDGFLLFSDYFTVRRQTPKADVSRLLAWQETGRKNLVITRLKFKGGIDSDCDYEHSDPSDDDGFNIVIADSCQRIFVYGLKLLWTLENRDVVWSWASGLSKAFEPPKPSPSRQYALKLLERKNELGELKVVNNDTSITSSSTPLGSTIPSPQTTENLGGLASPSPTTQEGSTSEKHEQHHNTEDEGTGNFMVNVVQPQFNLHSEEACGRFLLAAASGRILARSFHSVLHLGCEVIERALGTNDVKVPEAVPEMTWKSVELSVMLEHVQAHVAPTDVDPGAGIQWLPKIHRSSQRVKRTGALLERVFMPCQMYFRYSRHRSITTDFKVKPLKELSFNSPDIRATMTSRQFQVMLDVLSNLLFARLPKMDKNCLTYPSEDDDDIEEEVDVVIPYGIEEVELSRINLEKVERERKLLLDDIRKLSASNDGSFDPSLSQGIDGDLWMIIGEKPKLVHVLKLDLENKQKSMKAASSELRAALQKAAQLRLIEKEKNRSPYAIGISMRISKVVWSMIEEGKPFAEVEINDLAYDFDRDFKDIGHARFTVKSFIVKNSLPNAKSDMLLSAWNAPSEWGKNFMLRVDAKQGAPKDGRSPIELFQVDIYPLKIHLPESMYRMMWHYFFPEDEQDPQRRQAVWKVSTTSGLKRGKKVSSPSEAAVSCCQSIKELEACERQNATKPMKSDNLEGNMPRVPELRRTSSFDKTWEESVAESVAHELVMNAHSSSNFPSKSGSLASTLEQPVNETSKSRPKDAKMVKSARHFQEEKKDGKSSDDKRARPGRLTEFHNVKICQVELLLTYEGSRFPISDLRLLMDTFHREEFVGTWGRLFSRVKKHVIWGVLKSVTGMQGKKFKVKSFSQKEVQRSCLPPSDLILSDTDELQTGESDQSTIQFLKHPDDGAGDGFVTSIKGLFSSQRRKAKAFVLRTMRGDAEGDLQGDWSEGDAETSPFARQLTITKAKKLIRRHTKKFRPKGRKTSDVELLEQYSPPSSSKEAFPFETDSSDASSSEDLNYEVLPN